MDVDDLVAFLRARLDEREQAGRAATPGPWSADPTGTVVADADLRPDPTGGEILPEDGPAEVAECYRNERSGERGLNAAHIAHHDPATVLREVEAKRRILAAYEEARAWYTEHVAAPAGEVTGLWTAVQHLASVYAEHPDYRQEWGP